MSSSDGLLNQDTQATHFGENSTLKETRFGEFHAY